MRTRPHSYAQCPQSTRPGAMQADRASDTGPAFVDFAVNHSKPFGCVFQECAKGSPTGIVGRCGEPGVGQPGTRYIPHGNQPGPCDDCRGLFMRPILAAIGHLGMHRFGPFDLPGTLYLGQNGGIVPGDIASRHWLLLIRTGELVFQPQVNADLCLSCGKSGVFYFALEIHVPVPPNILGEAPSFEAPCEWPREPEAKALPGVGDRIVSDLDAAPFERHPAQRAPAAPPLQADFLALSTPCGVFAADFAQGVRVQSQLFRGASRQVDQVKLRQEPPIAPVGMQAPFVGIVPHEVDGPCHAQQMLAAGGVFDPVAVGQQATRHGAVPDSRCTSVWSQPRHALRCRHNMKVPRDGLTGCACGDLGTLSAVDGQRCL